MYKIKISTISFLFILISVLAVTSAFYYDYQFMKTDKQLYIPNLQKDKQNLSKLATKHQITIFTYNLFENQRFENNHEYEHIIKDVYTNVDHAKSPFHLKDKTSAEYETFRSNYKTTIHALSLLEKQKFADFRIIDNYNNITKFSKELTKINIDHKVIDVPLEMTYYDYEDMLVKALYLLIISIIIFSICIHTLSVKKYALFIIYNSKKSIILANLKNNLIITITPYVIVLLLNAVGLFFINNLARFDIVLNTYLNYGISAIILICIFDMLYLTLSLNKLNYVFAFKDKIAHAYMYKLVTIVSVISLILTSHYAYNIISSLRGLNTETPNISEIRKLHKGYKFYSPYIIARSLELLEEDYAYDFNTNLNDLFLKLQYEFNAVNYYEDEGVLYINANFLNDHNLVDENNKKITSKNKKGVYKLSNKLSIYEDNKMEIVTVDRLKLMRNEELSITGSTNFYVDYLKYEKEIKAMLQKQGMANVTAGFRQVAYSIEDKQYESYKLTFYQDILNFSFLFTTLIVTSILSFNAFVGNNRKKIALNSVYNKTILRKYLSFIVLTILMYAISIYIGYWIGYSLAFTTTYILVILLIVVFYSLVKEKQNINKWINKG